MLASQSAAVTRLAMTNRAAAAGRVHHRPDPRKTLHPRAVGAQVVAEDVMVRRKKAATRRRSFFACCAKPTTSSPDKPFGSEVGKEEDVEGRQDSLVGADISKKAVLDSSLTEEQAEEVAEQLPRAPHPSFTEPGGEDALSEADGEEALVGVSDMSVEGRIPQQAEEVVSPAQVVCQVRPPRLPPR